MRTVGRKRRREQDDKLDLSAIIKRKLFESDDDLIFMGMAQQLTTILDLSEFTFEKNGMKITCRR